MPFMGNTYALPADRSAPGLARGHARQDMALAGVEERVRRTVVLVVSELVTNAIQHADGPYALGFGVTDDRIRIQVTDHGPELPDPRSEAMSRAEPGGRGLAIVRRVSLDWGVAVRPDGAKTVWAEVPCR